MHKPDPPCDAFIAELQRQWDEMKHTWESGCGKMWSLYEVKQSRSHIPSTAVVEAIVKEVIAVGEDTQTKVIRLQDAPQGDETCPFELEWYMQTPLEETTAADDRWCDCCGECIPSCSVSARCDVCEIDLCEECGEE